MLLPSLGACTVSASFSTIVGTGSLVAENSRLEVADAELRAVGPLVVRTVAAEVLAFDTAGVESTTRAEGLAGDKVVAPGDSAVDVNAELPYLRGQGWSSMAGCVGRCRGAPL